MEHTTYPLVTIAIPTYNRANGYLRNAIACALKQTYRNIEVVISDNCSSDNTGEIVGRYSDTRIRYFRQSTNIGANNNFNFCLEKAQGSYFLLFHDDDSIDSDFIDICMRSAGYRTDIGLIRTGARVIDGEGNIKIEYQNLSEGAPLEDLFFSWFSGHAPLYLCNSLFNTAGLREIGGFRSRTNLYQDVVAEFKLAARHGRLDIPDVKASFRRHLDNMGSAAKVNDWCADSLHLLEVMCDLVPLNKDLIRKKGLIYFSRKNYRLARSIKSPLKRFSTYGMIYKTFGYRYSPIQFVLSGRGSRLRAFLRRKQEAASGA
jgi:glycosyltransferase involved in cell wall biosynthesis